MNNDAKWPNLSIDQKAIELAKTAMGWEKMTADQQMCHASELAQKAQTYKIALKGK